MSEARDLTRIPVDMLRPGLYVAELDRPWHEVPVMFQGFVVSSEEELAILQQHCRYVLIERDRSRPDSFEQTAGELASIGYQAAAGGAELHPSKHDLVERAQEALAEHREAREYVEQALNDVRLGRALNWRDARPLVHSLTEQVAHNTTAMLWLTRLHHKDMQASAHAVNVCVFATLFGMYLGLPEEQLQHIGLGALLHDVGKAALPPELLAKPGALSQAEWAEVKRHPVEGVELVFEDRSLPREVREIILMHHERIDGTGYPWGLGPKNIPDHVRVVHLANTYDSLTSERPYRAAQPADRVLQEMYNARELTVGAELVQAFIVCLGIFPVGTVVELSTGALGLVIDSQIDNRLKPTVLLVRTPDGRPYEKRVLVNLSAVPEMRQGQPTQFIRRAVNPLSYDLDVPGIIAFEFGIDWQRAADTGPAAAEIRRSAGTR